MLNIIKNTINRVFASGVDSDASAFITATGLSGTTQKSAITTLVKDLKSSGLWSKMKAVYPMVTDNYNLISYSEDLSNAYWSKNNLSITTNAINSPTGVLTADKIVEAATTGAHYLGNSAGVMTTTSNYTASTYFKAAERNWVYLYLYNGTSAFGAYFNLSNGTLGTINGGVTATITDAGNGWYRCTVSASITGTASSNTGITLASADNVTSYTGVAGNGIYQWGFQLEVGTTASAYQPILTTPSAFMASQMKYNLKDARDLDAAFRLTWSGGWTYSATGAKGNGTNNFATTYFNNASFNDYNSTSIYYYGNGGVNTGSWDIGNINSTPNTRITISPGTVQLAFQFNSANISTFTLSSLNGLVGMNRISSSQVNAFFNNTKIATVNEAVIANANANNFVIGSQFSNGFSNNSDRLFKFVSFGAGLSDQESLIYNQIIEKYQVALSRGVQAAQSFYYNSAYSNESNTYLYSTQITGTTQVSAINTLINGLKANNLWTKMKAVYPFVTDKWNLLGFTEDLTNAAWNKTNLSATLAETSPISGSNSYKIADTTTTNVAHLFAQGTILSGTSNTYTASAYFKAAEYNYVQIHPSGNNGCVFDLLNGVVSSTPGVGTGSILSVGNGWYRCSFTFSSYSGTNVHFSTNKTSTSQYSYAGTIGYGIYMSAPQVELNSVATTYQQVLGANNGTTNATNVAAQMKFNLVNPQDTDAAFRLAFSGGWTYSTNGAQPNGTNGFADTKLNPFVSLAKNNAHVAHYFRTAFTSNSGYGVVKADYSERMDMIQFSGVLYSAIGVSGQTSSSSTPYTSLIVGSRVNSTSNKLYKNNTLLNTQTAANSAEHPNANYWLGAVFQAGSFYSTAQTAFSSIGDGLSDAEVALLTQLVNEFQTTLSRNI